MPCGLRAEQFEPATHHRTIGNGATSGRGMQTQRFYLVLATDGDVSQTELVDVLDALGYHGVMVINQPVQDHEHPCPSASCIDGLRREGHIIPEGTDCCACWAVISG